MIFRFATCTLDTDRHELCRDGAPVHVEPQVFDLLALLCAEAGTLIGKERLIDEIWGGLNVSDSTIAARINAARRAVGDDGKAQAVIRTVPRRGIQMVAEVAAPTVSGPAGSAQEIRFARTPDGARIAWARSGGGPALLRVGHWMSHLDLDWHSPVWRPFLETLSRDRSLIRYDLRGTGLSEGGAPDRSVADFAASLLAVADAAGLDRFPLFAASQGVPVAIHLAARHPGRISGLVLYGGFAQGRAHRPAEAGDLDQDAVLALIRNGWGRPGSPFIRAVATLFAPGATPEQLDFLIRVQTATASPDTAAELRRAIDDLDVSDLLPLVGVPTLVVHARGDAVHPFSQSRLIAATIPGAQFVMLDSDNHIPLSQDPAWSVLMAETGRFLATLPA